MATVPIQDAGPAGLNALAFLDMIAVSEGTDNGRQPTLDHGYDVLVGGELFTSYAAHPNVLVQLRPGLASTAAGRYQLLFRYWVAYCKLLGLSDFSPRTQDLIALQQIKERRAFPALASGNLREAVRLCSNIWASFPGAGYGQHEQKYEALEAAYLRAGGQITVRG